MPEKVCRKLTVQVQMEILGLFQEGADGRLGLLAESLRVSWTRQVPGSWVFPGKVLVERS